MLLILATLLVVYLIFAQDADFGDLARGISYLCAGAASLATGYYYIFKKK
jgi:hypothetical protein